MSTHSRKARRSFQTPLDLVRSVSSVPAKDTGKRTVQIEEPREVQAIENVYEFFTKQRPVAWQYFSIKGVDRLRDTSGARFEVPLMSVSDGQVVVINHFSCKVNFIQDPTNAAEDNLRVNAGDDQLGVGFVYDLVSQNGSLYEVAVRDATGVTRIQGNTSLNYNVLDNGDSTSSLFVFEPDEISAEFTWTFDTVAGSTTYFPNNVPAFLLYEAQVQFELRGHKLNKSDGELLKSLLQNN